MKKTAFDIKRFKKAVFDANKELYTYINSSLLLEDLQYSNKIGYGGDNSLNIDLKAEEIFIKHLSIFANIYSEECGFLDFKSKYTIVLDPLDGSNNFLSQLPYYGTSLALKKKDNIVAAFVSNLAVGLITYKIFNEDIKYFSLVDFKYKNKLVGTKSNLAVFERAYDFPKICKKFNKKGIKFRNLGSTALSLCDARNYNFVLIAGKMRDFDILAGLYLSDDLFIFRDKNYLLTSKNYEKFLEIKEILKV